MNLALWFDESLSLRLVQTLLHFLWQGSAIGLVVVLSDYLLRNLSSRTKYTVHVSGLLAMVPCVLITFATVKVPASARLATTDFEQAGIQLASSSTSAILSDAVDSPTPAVQLDDYLLTISDGHSTAKASQANLSAVSANHRPSDLSITTAKANSEIQATVPLSAVSLYSRYLAAAYLVGVLLMTVRLLLALRASHALRRTAIPIADDNLLAMIKRQSRRLGLRAAPMVAYCQEISIPVLMGIVQPLILLPAAVVSGLSPDQLQALVSHELAHLRRFDPWINLLQRVIEAVLFFHPVVWYMSRRISAERENASDDLVLTIGFSRVSYADALVRMAELSASYRHAEFEGGAVMMAATGKSSSEFKRRVLRLLGGESVNLRPIGWGWLCLLLTIATASSGLIFASAWQSETADAEAIEGQDHQPHIGIKIENFVLRDYLGKEHQLSDYADSKAIVIAFLGAECPLTKMYGSRLAVLAEKYKPRRVTFLGINSNQQDAPSDLARYVRQHQITFPMLKDPGNIIADRFGAERTPEVFVLDEKRIVRYWGNIDDQFGVGYSRPSATKQFLVSALDAVLAGRVVTQPETLSIGCRIGRAVRKTPTGDITYTKQVAQILQCRCVECHRDGGIAPFAMDSYAEVVGWGETIREVIANRRMPPWHANPDFGHFSNDNRMSDEEKQLLDQWIKNGMPEGDPNNRPPPRTFVEGWTLGRPDLVVRMPEEFTVAPVGVVPYQYFTVDPGFTEGKWVRASEVRPGVPSVVHHVIVFINPPGGDPILEERGIGFEMVGGYVPGTPPMELADGVARYVPPGSTFVFQLHYTPDGTQRKDQTQIGLYFADPKSVQRTMQTGVAANLEFVIPPEAADYQVEATHRFDHDMELHALTPHMHYRGKSFRFEALYPNGSREILLDVPKFDFNWQNTYRLIKPKLMPEGTLLRCTAAFDNSAGNLSNPDSSIPVKWGEQTWEEMMIGYFEGVFLNQDLTLAEPRITPLSSDAVRVHFSYRPNRPVRSVALAGTFNEWNTSSHPLKDADGDGVYDTDVQLPKGPHRYKFVVDGNYWTHDPASRILTGFFHESFFVAGDQFNRRGATKP